ncbi:DUF3108 domain-containing protein [Pseudoalteromonas fenneropenaei]|uniref:DUF3108 domain-containing protein n=1 Tax=Pseudoalteromonas fenneropenaei TaxID=1737459 RepID=A0ABV7CIG2_9GAMM
MQFLTTKYYRLTAPTINKNKTCALLLCLGAVFSASFSSVIQASELAPYKATYNVLRKGKIHGEATRELSKATDETFVLKYHSNIEWMIFSDERIEETTFTIKDSQIHPVNYVMKREGTGPDKSFRIDFDPSEQKVKHSDSKYPLKLQWREDWQDLLSYQAQLRVDLMAGKTRFSYPIVDKEGDEKVYDFEVVGSETITLPVGNFETVKVRRMYDNDKRQALVWFAPSLDHMMVQLYKGKDGMEQFQIQLKSLNSDKVSL